MIQGDFIRSELLGGVSFAGSCLPVSSQFSVLFLFLSGLNCPGRIDDKADHHMKLFAPLRETPLFLN